MGNTSDAQPEHRHEHGEEINSMEAAIYAKLHGVRSVNTASAATMTEQELTRAKYFGVLQTHRLPA